MSTDMLTAPATDTVDGDDDVVTAAAIVWATLCALDAPSLEPEDRALMDAAQRHFSQQLAALAIEKAQLHEHIVSAVERGDWAALGIAEHEPPPDAGA